MPGTREHGSAGTRNQERLPISAGQYKYYRLGWSDLALFAIFEKLHVSADQVYFLGGQFQKIVEFRQGKVFILKK